MDKLNIEFNYTESLCKKGVKASGLFTVSRARQTVISAICLLVIANAFYVLIRTGHFEFLSSACAVVSLFLIVAVIYAPVYQINKEVSYLVARKKANILISKNEISYIWGKRIDPYVIDRNEFRGFIEKDGLLLVYFKNKYFFIPTDNLSDEEKQFSRDCLETYATYGSGKKTYEEKFIKNPTEKEGDAQ